MTLSEYESKALVEVVAHKQHDIQNSPRSRTPGKVTQLGGNAAKKVKSLPGADHSWFEVVSSSVVERGLLMIAPGLADKAGGLGLLVSGDRSAVGRTDVTQEVARAVELHPQW